MSAQGEDIHFFSYLLVPKEAERTLAATHKKGPHTNLRARAQNLRKKMGGEPAQPTSFATKAEMYAYVHSQLPALITDTPTSSSSNPAAHLQMTLANVSSLLFYALNAYADPNAPLQRLPINWVGFYLMTSADSMTLGPFQGRVACTKIKVGRGVCGTAVLTGKHQVVPDVHLFEGHIACDGDSESEIVVLLRAAQDQRIVGLLDIDSTRKHQFNEEEDLQGLLPVVEALGAALVFPFRPPVAARGAPDLAPTSAATSVLTTTSVAAPPPPLAAPSGGAAPTTVTPRFPNPDVALQPDLTTRRFGAWEFQLSELARILSQQEQARMEASLGIAALPEIGFGANSLRIVHGPSRLALSFSLFDVLQSAASFYKEQEYTAHVRGSLVIPTAESWKKSPFSRFDPKVDWAWRHNSFGLRLFEGDTPDTACWTVQRDDTAAIDWDMLRRTDVPILFYGSFQLFEDDLHDAGIVSCSVKFRVMEDSFFVLLRHVVRVDHVAVSCRDVRVFHKLASAAGVVPDVVAEEQYRKMDLSEDTAAEYARSMSLDALVEKMPVTSKQMYRYRSQQQ